MSKLNELVYPRFSKYPQIQLDLKIESADKVHEQDLGVSSQGAAERQSEKNRRCKLQQQSGREKTSNPGLLYRRGRVGRGAHCTPPNSHTTPFHTHNHSRTDLIARFSSLDGFTDYQTEQ